MSTFWQVVRFVTTGSLATLVYLAFSYFLKSILGVHYLLTVVIAYVVGVAFNFTVQKIWSFQEKTIHRLHLQIAQFIQWALTSLVCNLVLVSFMVETMRIWYLYAQAIATLIVAVASYFVYRFIFRS